MKCLIILFTFAWLSCANAQNVGTAKVAVWTNPPAGTANTLTNGLLGYWKMDEASGTREDSFASYDLSDNNTVASAVGKIGNAGNFEWDNSEYLSRSGTWAQQAGDFTIDCWIYCESLGDGSGYGRGVIRCHNGDSVGDWAVAIGRFGATGAVQFYHWTVSGDDADGRNFSGDAITAGSWFYIACRRSSGVYSVWINGASQGLTSADTSFGWGNVGFEMGRGYTGAGYSFDGLVDEVGLWSRALTESEIVQRYNSGAGVTLP